MAWSKSKDKSDRLERPLLARSCGYYEQNGKKEKGVVFFGRWQSQYY